MNYPIVVMAFNRPDYLKQVLDSLLQQQGADLAARPIALFQDGGFNEYSQMQRAAPADIEASVAVFRSCFPNARVEQSPTNLGVALNFDRAERWAFEELGAEAAIFLEDDMVLSPHYIRTIDRMLDMAMGDKRIGYVAAYGDWTLPLKKQRENPGGLRRLPLNWAFGLTRHQWLKNQPFMERYLSFVKNVDYRQRPHRMIFDLYTNHGMRRDVSSQDLAKLIASTLNGGVGINTTACLAKYIGKVGLHSTETFYAAGGFDKTEVYPDGDFAIENMSLQTYHRLMAEQAAFVEASSPKLERNTALTFKAGGSGLRGLRESFYLPEDWGVWAGTTRSAVSVTLPKWPTPPLRNLWITAAYFTAKPGEDVAVQVLGNGHLLGAVSLGRKHARVSLKLPEAVAGQSGNLDLVFLSAYICSPKSTGISEDARPLGLGLQALEIE